MENLLLWFILLIVIAACGIFGLWLLCNPRNGYPFHPYYIEPPIDYTPPPTVEPPRKHTVYTQTYQTYAKKKSVKIEERKSSSSP
ncbi:hypothetical protein MRX96_020203 [Rhipicephalus microplus]